MSDVLCEYNISDDKLREMLESDGFTVYFDTMGLEDQRLLRASKVEVSTLVDYYDDAMDELVDEYVIYGLDICGYKVGHQVGLMVLPIRDQFLVVGVRVLGDL